MIQPDEAMNLTEMRAYVKGFEDARNAMFDATDKFYRSNKTDQNRREEVELMAIKPILFNTEMVRAILDGWKTCKSTEMR